MKYSFVILLLIALITQSFSRSLVLADYLVNLDAYKKNCVNKAKPMLHCNGKCQMLKKMKRQEGDNSANAPIQKLNSLEVVLYTKCNFPILDIFFKNYKKLYFSFDTSISSFYLGFIFHPPTA